MKKDYTEFRQFVRDKLRGREKRFRHSEGVAETSAYLADRFSLCVDDALKIGIYHDAYRYDTDEKTPVYCKKHGIYVLSEEKKNPMLLHGALAAIHFRDDLGDVPEYYLRAVRHHTLGSVEMGVYGAVLYIADFTEPNRKHIDDDERMRIFSLPTIESMVLTILDEQRKYFKKEGMREASVTKELHRALSESFVFSLDE